VIGMSAWRQAGVTRAEVLSADAMPTPNDTVRYARVDHAQGILDHFAAIIDLGNEAITPPFPKKRYGRPCPIGEPAQTMPHSLESSELKAFGSMATTMRLRGGTPSV
jgi:hypothetical protein